MARLQASAHSPYWRGRILRAYLTSAIWNLRHRRGQPAASRTLHGGAALLAGISSAGSPSFWRAVLSNYQSETFRRGLER